MYEKMLVPFDGSESAEMALPYAVEIAARAGSQIMLVAVADPEIGQAERLYTSYLEHLQQQVSGLLKDRDAAEGSLVRTKVLAGNPAEQLLRYAEQSDVRLIVMASRGRSGKKEWPLGNTAAKILRAANIPVLLVRKPADSAAVRQRQLLKKVLAPLDGSKRGEAAVPYAGVLARLLDGQVVLLYVFPGQPDYPAVSEDATRKMTEHRKKWETDVTSQAEEYLKGVSRSLRDKAPVVSVAVEFGSPAERIIHYADSNAFDLIAVASHGRSGIGRWPFGSVTDKLLHVGDVPVLVVPAG